jgi:hypothetical protein
MASFDFGSDFFRYGFFGTARAARRDHRALALGLSWTQFASRSGEARARACSGAKALGIRAAREGLAASP